jgi:hypothetical protein
VHTLVSSIKQALALLANIQVRIKWVVVTNTLAYSRILLTCVKSLTVQCRGRIHHILCSSKITNVPIKLGRLFLTCSSSLDYG